MKKQFKTPPSEYSISPFWFWNDDLSIPHLKWQMDEMRSHGVQMCCISSRLGITIDYLSEEWFARIQAVVEYAKEIGLQLWLYDEDNWPSGYAGGKVLAEHPDECGKHIKRYTLTVADGFAKETLSGTVVCAFLRTGTQYTPLDWASYAPQNGAQLIVFCQEYTLWNPAYSKEYYPDMLSATATKCFIQHTHQQYIDRLQGYLGDVIKGFFVDEPGFYNNLHIFPTGDDNTIPWTDAFPAYFLEKNGYDIATQMLHLWQEVDETSAQVRIDFYETLCSMYKENFLDVLRDFCNAHGMALIGHLHYEEFMNYHIATQGNFMRALPSLDVIGLDRIDTNEEKIAEKYASSAAHLAGKKRVMSETYALSGWELTLQEMKRWVNYQYVRGVNMLVPHAFYSSIEGARSEECPPSEFYQNPYWRYFNQYATYANRLSYLLSQGVHRCNVALYYPISTMQKSYLPDDVQIVKEKDKKYQEVALALLDAQIDYDILPPDYLLQAHLSEGSFSVGQARYQALVLAQVELLSAQEIAQIRQMVAQGCLLVLCDDQPTYFADLYALPNVLLIPQNERVYIYTNKRNMMAVKTFLLSQGQLDFLVDQKDEKIRYMRRIIAGDSFYFITNEAAFEKKNTLVKIPGEWDVTQWDIKTGECTPHPAAVYHYPNYYLGATATGAEWAVETPCTFTELSLHFAAYGAFLLQLTPKRDDAPAIPTEKGLTTSLPLDGSWAVQIGTQTKTATTLTLQALEQVYFSGTFTASKRFSVPPHLFGTKAYFVAEQVRDCIEVTLNGKPCGYRAFAPYQLELTDALVLGENQIQIEVTNSILNDLRKLPQKGGIYGDLSIVFEG